MLFRSREVTEQEAAEPKRTDVKVKIGPEGSPHPKTWPDVAYGLVTWGGLIGAILAFGYAWHITH